MWLIGWVILMIFSFGLAFTSMKTNAVAEEYKQVNPAKQLEYIKENPLNVLGLAVRSTFGFYKSLTESSLGWLDTPLDWSTRHAYKLIAIIAMIFDFFLLLYMLWEPIKSRNLFRYREWLLPATTISLLLTSLFLHDLFTSYVMYLRWSPVGSPIIHGLQHRYYLPTFTLFIMYSLIVLRITLFDKRTVIVGHIVDLKDVGRNTIIVTVIILNYLFINYFFSVLFLLAKRYW